MTLTAPAPDRGRGRRRADALEGRPGGVGESSGGWFVRITILVVVLIWLIPTLGVLVTSFRPEAARQHAPAGGRCSATRSRTGSGRSRTTGRRSTPAASRTPSSTASP